MARVTKKSSPVTKPGTDNCAGISNPAARRACLKAKGKKKIIDTGTPNNPRNPVSRKKNRQY